MLVDSEETSITNSYVSGKISGGSRSFRFCRPWKRRDHEQLCERDRRRKRRLMDLGSRQWVSDSYAAVYVDGKRERKLQRGRECWKDASMM